MPGAEDVGHNVGPPLHFSEYWSVQPVSPDVLCVLSVVSGYHIISDTESPGNHPTDCHHSQIGPVQVICQLVC